MTAPTPSAEELDALEKRLREAGSRSDPETVEALGSDWQSIEHDAADAIKALRQQFYAFHDGWLARLAPEPSADFDTAIAALVEWGK